MCPGSKDASHVVNPRSRLRTKLRPGSAKSEVNLALTYLNGCRILENRAAGSHLIGRKLVFEHQDADNYSERQTGQ